MMYNLAIPLSAVLSVILLVMVIPGIAFLAEYGITKRLSKQNIYTSTTISALVCMYLFSQMYSTSMQLDEERITLDSLTYSNSIALRDVATISYHPDGLPAEYNPKWRTNGIGLYGYAVGKFRTQGSQEIYLQSTQPPFVVLTLRNNEPPVVFSADESVYNFLKTRSRPQQPAELHNNS